MPCHREDTPPDIAEELRDCFDCRELYWRREPCSCSGPCDLCGCNRAKFGQPCAECAAVDAQEAA